MNETETFTLPVTRKEVILRGYMTGFIDQEIQRAAGGANKTSYDIDAAQVTAARTSGIDPTPNVHIESDPGAAQIAADNKRLELMVTALDGSTGDILNRVLNLPVQDVKFILAEVRKLEDASKVQEPDPKEPTS